MEMLSGTGGNQLLKLGEVKKQSMPQRYICLLLCTHLILSRRQLCMQDTSERLEAGNFATQAKVHNPSLQVRKSAAGIRKLGSQEEKSATGLVLSPFRLLELTFFRSNDYRARCGGLT